MPGNLQTAVVSPTSTVLPQNLCTSFVRESDIPILAGPGYHDGSQERSLIQDGVNPPQECRTWKLAQRLSVAQLMSLQTFWTATVMGGLKAFYYYDPFDVVPGQVIGSNYDPTGVSIQGRATVFFRGNWQYTGGIGLNDVPQLMLVEVA